MHSGGDPGGNIILWQVLPESPPFLIVLIVFINNKKLKKIKKHFIRSVSGR